MDVDTLTASSGAATGERAALKGIVVLVEDMTTIRPTNPVRCRELGPLGRGSTHGLWLHNSTLARTLTGLPQGLIDQQVWVRDLQAAPSCPERYTTSIEGKESRTWLDGAIAAHARLRADQPHIVVADREADIYELYALLAATGGDVVLRAAQDRAILEDPGRLDPAARRARLAGTTAVEVRTAREQVRRIARVAVRNDSDAVPTALRLLPHGECALVGGAPRVDPAAGWTTRPAAPGRGRGDQDRPAAKDHSVALAAAHEPARRYPVGGAGGDRALPVPLDGRALPLRPQVRLRYGAAPVRAVSTLGAGRHPHQPGRLPSALADPPRAHRP